jgi:two-component system cell cycle response regulator DivK
MSLPQVDEKAPPFAWFFADGETNDHAANESRSRQTPSGDSHAPTILVVDDDLANLALAQALLQAEGFQVRVAIDGPSMFAVLKTCEPALILMDIQLPEIDGWELTSHLKADSATKEIPVIAITAYGKVGDEEKARQAGFVEFLAKPVSTRELPGIIRRHLAAD